MKSAHLINFPKIVDERGNLSFFEGLNHIPFEIKRTYWIYDVPGGEKRGEYAFKEQEQVIIALSGSFDIVLDNGQETKTFSLNRSYYGLYIPAGNWRHLENFSTNAVALIVCSTYYSEHDYIRDYKQFKNYSFSTIQKSCLVESNLIALNQDSQRGKESSINDCSLLYLDKNHRIKGNMTVLEAGSTMPFHIKRIYYLYDIPGGEERGGHAHKALRQWIIAVSGSFDVELSDGNYKKTVTLNRPYQALTIVPGIWRELKNFSSGAICLVVASHKYDESDYIREYIDFIKWKNNG